MVRALIDAGSRPDAVNSSGQLPLHSAVSTPRLYLGNPGLNPEFVDLLVNATRTDAHIGNHPGLVDSKATSRSLVNFRDNDGFTALHYAADVVCELWFEALLGRGADVDVLDISGRTPLLVLLDKRHGKPLQPTERGFYGWDILNYIVYKIVPCTRILRKAGADGNKQDSRGRSPFHCLAEMMASLPRSPQIHLSFGGGFQLRDSLLEFDIDLDLRDKQGRVARDIYPVEWFWA
ncbi:ankyrin repeat-containing domain protein [Plectosphaerella cucumerina]|uniref:Ankyrin repeat-containing domain protein n=1 Tax=Plectosphaerella cucumerina TaxID=40658 RepID=A0A8K0T9B1_9PEZI|nr:ankyrin repeat-containing domain protein [Plectosphaerella cucumerina]